MDHERMAARDDLEALDSKLTGLIESIDGRFTAHEGRIEQILADNLRATIISMAALLTAFAVLILGLG